MSKQDLSILFWLKRSIARKAKDGKAQFIHVLQLMDYIPKFH
ncbi:hypothetical protein SAMN04488505_102228 [Chitinophaga rupis]|uniref:Uncharacterized protein n=1 Tax=Chitinophaga rupis TaxID=573321 RepID=A0A1H7Q262_9BACT|nr:hypothetical protein SAMN04488505_102228 [Chitinophaga rupis]